MFPFNYLFILQHDYKDFLLYVPILFPRDHCIIHCIKKLQAKTRVHFFRINSPHHHHRVLSGLLFVYVNKYCKLNPLCLDSKGSSPASVTNRTENGVAREQIVWLAPTQNTNIRDNSVFPFNYLFILQHDYKDFLLYVPILFPRDHCIIHCIKKLQAKTRVHFFRINSPHHHHRVLSGLLFVYVNKYCKLNPLCLDSKGSSPASVTNRTENGVAREQTVWAIAAIAALGVPARYTLFCVLARHPPQKLSLIPIAMGPPKGAPTAKPVGMAFVEARGI